MPHAIAKLCPMCAAAFTLDALVESPEVQPIGLTMVDQDPDLSMFFFNHLPQPCLTTFALPIRAFEGLVQEEIPERTLAGSPECEGHCKDIHDHAPCGQECRNAPYRRFMIDVLMPRGKREIPK